jgi:zinc protease
MLRTTLARARALFTVAWLAASFVASAAPEPDTALHEYRLENGLKVLVKVDRRSPVAVSMLWYRVGSMDEINGRSGVSHVLEHMMFKGTHVLGPGEFSKAIARAGGRDNAFTSREYTAYHQRLHRDQVALAMRLEADRMPNLALDAEEFGKEIRVVMEERRQRTDDNPQGLLFEQLLATALLSNPARRPVIGWMSDLQSLTIADVRDWYRSWYAPNNATLVVAGDVDPEEVYSLAQQHFGPVAARPVPGRKPQQEPAQRGIRRISVKAPSELPHLAMAYRVPVLKDLDNDWEPYALSVLSAVLDGHDAARLPRALVHERRIAHSIGSSYEGVRSGPGLFIVSGAPAAGRSVAELEAAWRAELGRLINAGVTEQELKRVKAQVIASQVYQRDSVFAQASQIGRYDALGLPLDTAERVLNKIQAVTAEQLRDVARRYFVDDGLTVAAIEPQPVDRSRPLAAPPADEDVH